MFTFRNVSKLCKTTFGRVFETNLPPFLRLFHDRDIGPASPIVFSPSGKIADHQWTTNIRDVFPAPSATIPLKVAAYDIECMSKTGNFPAAIKQWSLLASRIIEDLAKDSEIPFTDAIMNRLIKEGMLDNIVIRKKITEALTDSLQTAIENGNEKVLANALYQCVKRDIGDPIIQIGITIRNSTDMLTNIKRRVFVVGSVVGPEYVSCDTEADALEAFEEFLREEDPDVLCGYNTFGFDDKYVADRCTVNGMKSTRFGRIPAWGESLEHKVFELASGKYSVNYLKMPGRLTIDLLLNIRREHNLDSYTLDNVASTFLRDKVLSVEGCVVKTPSTRGLTEGNFVCFDIVGNTSDPYREGHKFKVVSVTPSSFTVSEPLDEISNLEWSFTKDDVSPQDIFRLHEGDANDRATIAKYCIQDCDLVLTLMAKLDTLSNARGMADVCFVPLQYLFLRGQGIKIFSRVAYEASKRNQLIPVQESFEGDSAYEGAIVISPKIGMYLDTPIAVLDFNSLYPSSMIGENLSPDTLLCMKTYNTEGRRTSMEGIEPPKDVEVNEVSYDIKEGEEVVGKCVCIYAKPVEGNELSIGLIPRSLEIMLKKRKEARKKMADPSLDEAQKSVFNGLQLAYKVVANSIYGQMGSKTSAIRKICVAACTTAVGRRQLLFAKSTVEKEYGADVVYGDTDSIFVKFPDQTLAKTIDLAKEAATIITKRCRHSAFVIGYEKTFYPFILFCRKRYVGMKYEEDTTHCHRASMGIVLRRRDNAPIVKDVFGGALDVLLSEKNADKAAAFVKTMIAKVVKGEFPIEKFAITKQLRDDYAAMKEGYTGTATIPAHRVLADRMTKRDPGSAPNVGERLKYVYIKTVDKKLQGDKIEHIEYARAHKLELDTLHYITNQIQNPVAQLFALCIENLEGYVEPRIPYATLYEQYLTKLGDHEEATLKVLSHKESHLDKLLFLGAPYILNTVRKSRTGPLDSFFKKIG